MHKVAREGENETDVTGWVSLTSTRMVSEGTKKKHEQAPQQTYSCTHHSFPCTQYARRQQHTQALTHILSRAHQYVRKQQPHTHTHSFPCTSYVRRHIICTHASHVRMHTTCTQAHTICRAADIGAQFKNANGAILAARDK